MPYGDELKTPKGVPGFAQSALNVLVGTSILSDNGARIGKGVWTWSLNRTGAGAFTFKVMTSVSLLLICSPTS